MVNSFHNDLTFIMGIKMLSPCLNLPIFARFVKIMNEIGKKDNSALFGIVGQQHSSACVYFALRKAIDSGWNKNKAFPSSYILFTGYMQLLPLLSKPSPETGWNSSNVQNVSISYNILINFDLFIIIFWKSSMIDRVLCCTYTVLIGQKLFLSVLEYQGETLAQSTCKGQYMHILQKGQYMHILQALGTSYKFVALGLG